MTNENRYAILYGGAGSGKCFKSGTYVVMADGKLKEIQDIQSGDFVLGIDSKPKLVYETHTGFDNLYKVSQKRGIYYVVNSEHILTLKRGKTKSGRYPEIKGIYEPIVKDYLDFSILKKNHFYGYRGKADFPYQEVELDPYFLGIWLGDGTNSNTQVTTQDEEVTSFLGEYAEKLGMKYNLRKCKGRNCYSATIVRPNGRDKNKITEMLDRCDLRHNKHIPYEYKVTEYSIEFSSMVLGSTSIKILN